MRLARYFALASLLTVLCAALPAAAQGPNIRFYDRTGHTVSGAFLTFLHDRGDPDLLGAPLTEAIVQDNVVVQYFERGALQLNAGMDGELRPLPAALLPRGPFPKGEPPSDPNAPVKFFPQTGQTVGYAILDFYQSHGGQAVFGLPVSPQIGNAQWFERARLDWEPSTQTVSLAPLGTTWMKQAGLNPDHYATQWLATFEDTRLLDEPSQDAGGADLGQFRPLLEVGSQPDYIKVWDPTRNRYGWVAAAVVGPGAAPDWLSGLANAEYIGEPARVAKPIFGQFPDPAPELEHNQSIWATARITAANGDAYVLDENGTAIPDSIVRLPRTPPRYYPGKWIDADLSEPVLVTAYEGDRPVYAAMAVKGTDNTPTRPGVWSIIRRVADETMDSATIGIPRGAPGSYYLTGVLYTQYFTSDGASIHYNYWRANWGYAGSHGCLGMNLADSKWFWDWATVGTPVVVRYS